MVTRYQISIISLFFIFLFCLGQKQIPRESKKEWEYENITIENLFQMNETEKNGEWAGSQDNLNSKLKNHYYFIYSFPLNFRENLLNIEQRERICYIYAVTKYSSQELASHFFPREGLGWTCYYTGPQETYITGEEAYDESIKFRAFDDYTKFLLRHLSSVTCKALIDNKGSYNNCRCLLDYQTDIGQPSVKRDFVRIMGRCNKKEACAKYNVDCD